MKTVSRLAPMEAISYKPRAFSAAVLPANARVAQLVEQRIENPRVTGSIPVPGTILFLHRRTRRPKARLSGPDDARHYWLRAAAGSHLRHRFLERHAELIEPGKAGFDGSAGFV